MDAKAIWDQEHPNLGHQEIIYDLVELPERIALTEKILYDAKLDVVTTKDAYNDAECRLLLEVKEDGTPRIDGKNEAIRQAQMKSLLLGYHTEIRRAEATCMEAERQYNLAVNTFRAMRSVAALLSGGEVK